MAQENDSHRRKRAQKISEFIETLRNEFSGVDLSPLSVASQKCFNPHPSLGDDYWKEEVLKLNLGTIKNLRNVRPKNVTASSISVEFSYKAWGKCQDTSNSIDPLTHVELSVNILGRNEENKNLICAWHFDRHISENDDNEPLEPHPLYHFQFGGRSIHNLDDNEDYDFGSSLFMESPRLFHPPLNLILSINFLIAQFYSDKWKNLKLESDYRRIVKREQNEYWAPFFSKLSSFLDKPKSHKEAEKLMPILIR